MVFKVEPVALTQTGGTFHIYHIFLTDSGEKVMAQRKELTENCIGEDLTSEWAMEIDNKVQKNWPQKQALHGGLMTKTQKNLYKTSKHFTISRDDSIRCGSDR